MATSAYVPMELISRKTNRLNASPVIATPLSPEKQIRHAD
jgi:hypothetical protein